MHFTVPGALAYFVFDSFFLGLGVAVALSVAALFIGDLIAPRWQKYYGLEGTTCTTMIHIGWTLPFAWVVNKIIDFIPGLNKLDVDLESVQKRLGVFGEPAIIGVIVGCLLGIVNQTTHYNHRANGDGRGWRHGAVAKSGWGPYGRA